MTDELTEDPFEEEKIEIGRLSNEARELLANPMLQRFFEDRKQECFEAFCRLPFGCKLEEYQTVQHDYHSVIRLEQKLNDHVDNFKLLEMRDLKVDVEGI